MLRQFSCKLLQRYNHVTSSILLTKLSVSSGSGNVVEEEPKKEISKAMKAYLERAREHDEFMQYQNREYQIGKRHLANMMGENPETFTQEDVDNAIAYLFPSGLYEKKARPMMKPPEEVFPQRKAAEFDVMGRPYHFLFYTGKPNFYKLLYDIVEKIKECERFEDAMNRKNSHPDPNLTLQMSGYQWLDKITLEKQLVELISDKEYNNFVSAMERLCTLPFSYKVQEFIINYRRPLMSQTKTYDIPKLQYDKEGRAYITTYECLRKRARGDVTIKSPGTGKVTINGEDIGYFKDIHCREQKSLTITDNMNDVVGFSKITVMYDSKSFSNTFYLICKLMSVNLVLCPNYNPELYVFGILNNLFLISVFATLFNKWYRKFQNLLLK